MHTSGLTSMVLWCYYGAMPNVNLRLTDAEHGELVEASRENGRSLQREIVWRLFRAGVTAPVVVEASAEVVEQVRYVPRPSLPQSVKEFKGPDPKGGKK